MNSPYRVPGTVDPPLPPKRWGVTRYRKWMYRYVRQVVALLDALQFFTVAISDKDPLISLRPQLSSRDIVRVILKPRKPYGGCL